MPLPDPPIKASLRAIFPFFSRLIAVGSNTLMLRELGMSLILSLGSKKYYRDAASRQPPCERFLVCVIKDVISRESGIISGAKAFDRTSILHTVASQIYPLLYPFAKGLQVRSRRCVPPALYIIPSRAQLLHLQPLVIGTFEISP